MDSMKIKISDTIEYREWYGTLSEAHKKLISGRLDRIRTEGYLGKIRPLGDGLFELKWKNGLRIYFCRTGQNTLLLLLGGLKNAQQKDIDKARRLL
jgi:putative addiction module killer protein